MKRTLLLLRTLVPLALVSALAVSCAHQKHTEAHNHTHGPACGHVAIMHDGHVDYLDQGHLHHPHGQHVDEHMLSVCAANPDHCTPGHGPAEHPNHQHNATCGHPRVPHGDHTDYLINGHLHHPHGDHCDDHGAVQLASE